MKYIVKVNIRQLIWLANMDTFLYFCKVIIYFSLIKHYFFTKIIKNTFKYLNYVRLKLKSTTVQTYYFNLKY